ncbi:MAG: hypothetical protein FD131_4956 [Rhodocyclaceae bacterium]|nr:MAG: hypothetical protein FD131_4956 [Rhodocyclaceae bacterium]
MKVSSLIAAVLFAGTTMTGVVFAERKGRCAEGCRRTG